MADELYGTRSEWLSHEENMHRQAWKCRDHPEIAFSTQDSFYSHLKQEHPDLKIEQLNALAEFSKTALDDTRECCQICLMDLDHLPKFQTLFKYMANHFKRLATFALPRNIGLTYDGASQDSNKVAAGQDNEDRDDLSDVTMDYSSIDYAEATHSVKSQLSEYSSEGLRPLLEELYDRLGDMRVFQERLEELYSEWEEERARRLFLVDQGENITRTESEFQRKYEEAQKDLTSKVAAAREDVDRLRKECEEAGVQIEQRPASSNDDETEHGVEQSRVEQPWAEQRTPSLPSTSEANDTNSEQASPVAMEHAYWRDDAPLSRASLHFTESAPFRCLEGQCTDDLEPFKTLSAPRNHMTGHLPPSFRPYVCGLCIDEPRVDFANIDDLRRHLLYMHKLDSRRQGGEKGNELILTTTAGDSATQTRTKVDVEPYVGSDLQYTPSDLTRIGSHLSDYDMDKLPARFKRIGEDWHAVFNPLVPRTLDVELLHSISHDSVVCCVRFSPDGKLITTCCNHKAQIFDAATGAQVCRLQYNTNEEDMYVRSVCFSPDGSLLVTGDEEKIVRAWDIAARAVRCQFTRHEQDIYAVDYGSDGRHVLSCSGDRTVRVWDLLENQCVLTLQIEDGLAAIAVSPDFRFVAAGALDKTVRVWSLETAVLVERTDHDVGHDDSVYSVAYSPTGTRLLTGSLDKTIKVWNLERLVYDNSHRYPIDEYPKNDECLRTYRGHTDFVLSVVMTADEKWIMSGSKDCAVGLWDTASEDVVFMLKGHRNSVISVATTPTADGVFATASGDKTARIWR